MEVLHIITGLSRGGAERALNNLIKKGTAPERDCMVLSLTDVGAYGPELQRAGIPVHELKLRKSLSSLKALARLNTIIKGYQPSIIQGWMYHGNLVASLARILASGRPTVAWNIRHSLYGLSEENLLTRQVIRLNRLFSHKADVILYNSSLARQQHEAFGFSSGQSMVIPNGFDTVALEPNQQRRSAARKELKIDADEKVVGHIARFHPMKDHACFLRAAVRVLEDQPKTRFLMIGRDVSLHHPKLREIVPHSLVDRFITLGERSDVHELIQAIDILAQSSWSEAFPNVLGEAMASGVPCVTTDVGDSATIVGDAGYVVPARSPYALADAISRMLAMRTEEIAVLGENARQRIVSQYSLTSVVYQYEELYRKLGPPTRQSGNQCE